jgi:hypothetical protein
MISGLALAALTSTSALADSAVVEDVSVSQSGDSWTFSVTLSHGDIGWDDYADGWEVLTEDGDSLGVRVLAHPHVNEQPFTRSLGGVSIPEGTTKVFIRARTNTDGWGEDLYEVDLSGS